MRKILLAVLVFILLVGCAAQQRPTSPPVVKPQPVSFDSCSVDDDCVCGGIDTMTDRCFLGNKDYYEKNVDKSKQCPDFCSGIAGNLVVRCIDNKCIQMLECIADSDCVSGKCTRNRCV